VYYASGYLPASNVVKLAVLLVAAVVFWGWLDGTRAGRILAIMTAITGPLTEIILVHAGAFEHLQPDLLGIPIWLPALYAASAPVIGQGARKFLGTR
jgi:Mg2+/citrate symporter